MKKQKLFYKICSTRFVMVISFLLLIVISSLMIFMQQIDKQTEDTTTLFMATVIDTEVTNSGERVFAKIYTKEYNSSLYISSNIGENININDVKNLKCGQTVSFRIENIIADQMNKAEFINIVSLNTDTNEIFSLEEYNQFVRCSAYPARIIGLLLISACIFVLLFSFFTRKGQKCYEKIKTNQED